MEKFQFCVLGSRGSRPVSGREFADFGGGTSCYLLRSGEYALILDCGTGLYDAAPYLAGCTRVDILVTHLHYDHILGLLHWSVIPRDAKVRLYAGMAADGSCLDPADFIRPPYWPVAPDFEESLYLPCGSPTRLTQEVSVLFAPANHPDNATVVRVDTPEGAMCLVCDWEHGLREVPRKITEDCRFMLYDGMFTGEEYPAREGWGHSTWQEGVKLARERRIPHLMITHHLPEHTDGQLLQMEQEAAREFGSIRFLRAGDVFTMEGVLCDGL